MMLRTLSRRKFTTKTISIAGNTSLRRLSSQSGSKALKDFRGQTGEGSSPYRADPRTRLSRDSHALLSSGVNELSTRVRHRNVYSIESLRHFHASRPNNGFPVIVAALIGGLKVLILSRYDVVSC